MASHLDRAHRILREAEGALRSLMKDGIEHHRYGDVAAIARMADRLTSTLEVPEDRSDAAKPRKPRLRQSTRPRRANRSGGAAPREKAQPRRGQRTGNPGYPRFRRDDHDLVKLGWSRKQGAEYVQRTPKATSWTLSKVVRERYSGRRFTMSEILESIQEMHGSIPSYQVYAAHAWLRSVGAVSGNGRTGYRGDPSKLSSQSLEEFWEALPELDTTTQQDTQEVS